MGTVDPRRIFLCKAMILKVKVAREYLRVRLAKHADISLVCVQKLASARRQGGEDAVGIGARHLDHRGR